MDGKKCRECQYYRELDVPFLYERAKKGRCLEPMEPDDTTDTSVAVAPEQDACPYFWE